MRGRLPVALLLAASPAFAGSGMYVWDEAVGMTNGRPDGGVSDATAQERVLRVCRDGPLDVRRLYFLADPSAWNESSLRSFLAEARARGIDVYAVPVGAIQDAWIRPFRLHRRCDHEAVLAWVREILEFDARGGEARFAGVQLDIEPHGARSRDFLFRYRPVWRSGRGGLRRDRRNQGLAREYLGLLDRVRECLDGAHPRHALAVTLPTWLDRDDGEESYRLRHGSEDKAFIHHVQDRVDFVTLMNYMDGSNRDSAGHAWDDIADEVRYGPAESLFETSPPDPRGVSLLPGETLYEEGEMGLLDLARQLSEAAREQPNFLGCAVHHYQHAYGGGAAGWPRHDKEAGPYFFFWVATCFAITRLAIFP